MVVKNTPEDLWIGDKGCFTHSKQRTRYYDLGTCYICLEPMFYLRRGRIDKNKFCSKACFYVHRSKETSGTNHRYWGKSSPMLGKAGYWSGKERLDFRGTNNPNYKPSLTEQDRLGRDMPLYYAWRKEVLARDDFTCQITGTRGGSLEVHHLASWAENPDLRFDVNNGITLSKHIHRDFHKKYGRSNTTLEQFTEYREFYGK